MSQTKPKLEQMNSPKAVAVWPRLSGEPDTKFDKDGVWKVTLALEDNSEVHQKFLTALEQRHAAAVETAIKEAPKGKKVKVADPPWKREVDKEGNETGRTLVNFKQKAAGQRKDGTPWSSKPFLCDAKGNAAPSASVGGGSVIRVNFAVMPFYVPALGAGISLRMQGVQIIELHSYSRDAKSMGFEEEDGYEFSASEGAEASGASDTGEASGKDEFAL